MEGSTVASLGMGRGAMPAWGDHLVPNGMEVSDYRPSICLPIRNEVLEMRVHLFLNIMFLCVHECQVSLHK